MKYCKIIIILVFALSASLALSLSFSVSAAPVFSTGKLPLPLVNPVTQWFETNESVHFGNNEAAVDTEGVYITPYLIANKFSDVYMGEDAFNDDGYVAAGYYSGNYVTISSSSSNGWTDSTNFMGGPYLYATNSEVRTMAPGAVIEFYVHVGNVQLKQYNDTIVNFNRITGVRIGRNVSSSGTGFIPVPAGSIEYEIISYQDKNLYADSQQNLRRLVQKVRITNVSTEGVYFSGMQLIFGISTENGLGIADPSIVPYGYKQYRFELSISPVLTYNVTSRNETYLENIGGIIGTFDDKYDSMNDSLGNINNGIGDVTDALQDLNGYFTGVPDLDKWASEQSLLRNISNNLMDRVVLTPLWSPIEPLYVSFMNVMWNCVDRLGRLGVPYNNPQLSFIELSKTDESKTGYFNLYDFVMWYTSIFLTRAVIFAVSAKCRDLDKPIGDDEE